MELSAFMCVAVIAKVFNLVLKGITHNGEVLKKDIEVEFEAFLKRLEGYYSAGNDRTLNIVMSDTEVMIEAMHNSSEHPVVPITVGYYKVDGREIPVIIYTNDNTTNWLYVNQEREWIPMLGYYKLATRCTEEQLAKYLTLGHPHIPQKTHK